MTDVCAIHANHTPRNLTLESHHLIPRAWQAVWTPPEEHRVIWAPRTIELCPTGHRNVHLILVAIMRAFEATTDADPNRRVVLAMARAMRDYGRLKEFDIAAQAPRLWQGRGGDIQLLIDHQQYGFGLGVRATPAP